MQKIYVLTLPSKMIMFFIPLIKWGYFNIWYTPLVQWGQPELVHAISLFSKGRDYTRFTSIITIWMIRADRSRVMIRTFSIKGDIFNYYRAIHFFQDRYVAILAYAIKGNGNFGPKPTRVQPYLQVFLIDGL